MYHSKSKRLPHCCKRQLQFSMFFKNNKQNVKTLHIHIGIRKRIFYQKTHQIHFILSTYTHIYFLAIQLIPKSYICFTESSIISQIKHLNEKKRSVLYFAPQALVLVQLVFILMSFNMSQFSFFLIFNHVLTVYIHSGNLSLIKT